MGKKTYKTYHRYSGGAFFTGFLCLAFFAVFGLFLFMPALTIDDTIFSGFNIVVMGGGSYVKDMGFLSEPIVAIIDDTLIYTEPVKAVIETGTTENILFGIIAPFHWILEIAFSACFALSIIIGLFVAILGIFWLITGRLLLPKSSLVLARFSHSLFDIGVGLFYFYLVILTDFAKDTHTITMDIFPWVTFGVQIAITILMHITWRISFRHREFDPHKKGYVEGEPTAKERKKAESKMVPVYEKDVSAHGDNIPDHAYANDATLTKGNIPAGVIFLGNNAFANCRNLETVTIPQTVEKIGVNCFRNTPNLKQITYLGTKEDWRQIKRGGNWLVGAGTTTIQCRDGAIVVNPNS